MTHLSFLGECSTTPFAIFLSNFRREALGKEELVPVRGLCSPEGRVQILNDMLGFKLQGVGVCGKSPFQLVTLRTLPRIPPLLTNMLPSPQLSGAYVSGSEIA